MGRTWGLLWGRPLLARWKAHSSHFSYWIVLRPLFNMAFSPPALHKTISGDETPFYHSSQSRWAILRRWMVCVCVCFGGKSSAPAFVQYMSIKGLIERREGPVVFLMVCVRVYPCVCRPPGVAQSEDKGLRFMNQSGLPLHRYCDRATIWLSYSTRSVCASICVDTWWWGSRGVFMSAFLHIRNVFVRRMNMSGCVKVCFCLSQSERPPVTDSQILDRPQCFGIQPLTSIQRHVPWPNQLNPCFIHSALS